MKNSNRFSRDRERRKAQSAKRPKVKFLKKRRTKDSQRTKSTKAKKREIKWLNYYLKTPLAALLLD
jgi:hypothetical protein